jgi:hypothetical protein
VEDMEAYVNTFPDLPFLTVDLNPKFPAILSFFRETINKGITNQFIQSVAQSDFINA